MTRRLILSGILACSLAAVVAIGPAGAAQRNTLRGHTSQGQRIKLAVTDRALNVLHFKAQLKCRDGSKLELDESGFLKTPVSRKGHFKDVQYGSTDTVYMKGSVNGKAVNGKLRLTDRVGKVRCKSRWLKFHLKRH